MKEWRQNKLCGIHISRNSGIYHISSAKRHEISVLIPSVSSECQSLGCLHTQSLDVDEGPDQILGFHTSRNSGTYHISSAKRDMGQYMRFLYFSNQRAAKAQASLRICTDSPEPLLLAYTKYGCRWRLRPNFRHLAWLDMPAWVFIRGICEYAISTSFIYWSIFIFSFSET